MSDPKIRFFQSGHSLGTRAGWALLACVAAFYTYAALRGLTRINDFDVFHLPAQWAWERDPGLYRNGTREDRHFLYPPAAGFLMMPLAWLPYLPSGLIWTALRLAALAAVVAITLRWSREEGWRGSSVAEPWIVAIAVLACFRFLRTDFGNGQINLHLLALALIGLRLTFTSSAAKQAAGGAILAVPILIKASPLLFLGIPLLHRRWAALAGSAAGLVAGVALTWAWFGTDLSRDLWREWNGVVGRMYADKIDTDDIISVPEFVAVVTHTADHRETPELRDAAAATLKRLWRYEALALGALFLAVRTWRRRSGRGVSPLWDVTVVAIGLLLLTPTTRKAHVVAVFPAVLALAGLIVSSPGLRQPRAAVILFMLGSVSLLVSRSIPVEALIPGLNANPAILLAVVEIAAALALAHLPQRSTEEGGSSKRRS